MRSIFRGVIFEYRFLVRREVSRMRDLDPSNIDQLVCITVSY